MNAPVTSLLTPIVAMLIALLVSIAIIPLMMRLAPYIGMIDLPDPRKVHANPIPRVGGTGIALGAMLGMMLFLPMDRPLVAILSGALILVVFGAWDDMAELNHYPKFLGQIAAAALVIWYGGIWLEHLPFLDQAVNPAFGKPFTLVVIIGVINAINHSDGLDGLAGGESLFSLGVMAGLGFLSGNSQFLVIAAAVCGGLLGFLRFNTHPATVFMGDLGSQFLGFALAVLGIMLTQQVNPDLSRALPLLLIGLPIADILAVLFQRIRGGMHWFKATRNHVHHRLLALGFDHYQAVLIIYSVQALLTLSAIPLAYESNMLIAVFYLIVCASVFGLLMRMEGGGWRLAVATGGISWTQRFFKSLGGSGRFARIPVYFVQAAVPIGLLVEVFALDHNNVSSAIALPAIVISIITLLVVIHGPQRLLPLYRALVYGAISALAYCMYLRIGAQENDPASLVSYCGMAYFALLALAIGWIIFLAGQDGFRATTMDFLIATVLVSAAIFTRHIVGVANFWEVAIKMTILFYGCELIIVRGGVFWNRLLGGTITVAMAMVACLWLA